MSSVDKVKREIRTYRYYGGILGIVCHYLNPQRLQGNAYRFPPGSQERERRLKWISYYHKVYSQTAKVLLGITATLCAICIRVSMASPLR